MRQEAATGHARSLIALDLTRFACALAVVVFHYAGWMPGLADDMSVATAPLRVGWIGVELFFVLSGVVIAWSAEGSAPMAFLGRRALRLAPAVWVCATLTAGVLLADGRTAPADVLHRWFSSVAFAPVGAPIDMSYWTLSIEVSFYLLVGLALRGGATLDRIERVGVMLGCVSLTYWLATLCVDVLPMQNRLAQLLLLPHGCFFALGVLIRVRQRRGRGGRTLAMMAALGLACVLEIWCHAGDFPLGGGLRAWALGVFALGLIPIVQADRLQPWLAKHVRATTAVTLGLTTYPLYLIHQQLGMVMVDWLDAAGLWRWAALGVTFATSLALSVVVARRVEPAMRRGLTAAVSRRRAPAPDSLPNAFPSAG